MHRAAGPVGVAAALCGFVVCVSAQTTNQPPVFAQTGARSVELTFGAANPAWRMGKPAVVAGAPDGAALLKDLLNKAPSPKAGETINVDIVRKVPFSKLAKAIAKSLPVVSTIIAGVEILEAIRCQEAPGGTGECDMGQPQVLVPGEEWSTIWSSAWWPSYDQAAAFACGNRAAQTNHTYEFHSVQSVPWQGTASCYGRQNSTCYVSGIPTTCPSGQYYGHTGSMSMRTAGNSQVCPAATINGVSYAIGQLQPGADGQCPTGNYIPTAETPLADRIEQYAPRTRVPEVADGLSRAGKDIEHDGAPQVEGLPASVHRDRQVETRPDGITVRDTWADVRPTPSGYEWVPREVVTEYEPGATIPPPESVQGGTVTTGGRPSEPLEIITCGLPNTPPCKIDESGTPSSVTIPDSAVTASKGTALDKIGELGSVPAPAWSWSFSLPSACSPLLVGPFAGVSVDLDMCQYQPMFHDLMSLIWIGGTLWICVGIVGRTLSAG